MKKVTPDDQLRYEFDNFLSRGTAAMVAALFTVTACLILSTAAILVAVSLRPGASPGLLNFPDAVWLTATRMLDPGVVADDSGWSFRLIGILVTLCGVLLSSALIGILVNGLDQSFDKLRRGRTRVVEAGHTLILGWSPHIYTILHELACANHNRRLQRRGGPVGPVSIGSACVVILADKDRLEMEEEIHLRLPEKLGTRFVCRSGDPLDPDVLKIVSPETARAIIILSPGGDHPDLPVGRALLALTRARENSQPPAHIVTAVQRSENLSMLRMIGDERAQIFLADRILGYLSAKASFQPGLGPVYGELLRFEGMNIHFADSPALAGITFGEAHDRLANAVLIGLQSGEGTARLNPPLETVLQPGDRLIVIHKDGTALQVLPRAQVEPNWQAVRPAPPALPAPQRLLILGWNRRAPLILEHLELAAHQRLEVRVFAPFSAAQMQASCSWVRGKPLQVMFEEGDPLDRLCLEKLVAEDTPHILILGPDEQLDRQHADVFAIVAYLHLRDLAKKTGKQYSILAEIRSERKGEQAVFDDPADATISNGLVALVLAQLAENKELGPILVELLGPGGAQILLRPAGDYVRAGERVNFQTVVTAAGCRGETALGYRLLSEVGKAGGASGVHLNPEKSISIIFTEQDEVILLANEGQHSR